MFGRKRMQRKSPQKKELRDKKKRPPILSEKAQKYLAINATSVTSERLFSRAGKITTTSNSNLLPENI
jgi:hypothetical protein